MVVIGMCVLFTACATKPASYQDLSSSGRLRPSGVQADQWVAFNTDLNPVDLKAMLRSSWNLRESTVAGTTSSAISEQFKIELVRHADHHFTRELARRHLLVAVAAKGSLRMRVTITGARGSVPVVATATKLTPVGLVLSGLRTVRDKEGNFSGAVMYAVVTRQYPNALNIPATILPLGAAKAGIERGASIAAAALKALMAPENRLPRG